MHAVRLTAMPQPTGLAPVMHCSRQAAASEACSCCLDSTAATAFVIKRLLLLHKYVKCSIFRTWHAVWHPEERLCFLRVFCTYNFWRVRVPPESQRPIGKGCDRPDGTARGGGEGRVPCHHGDGREAACLCII